MLRRCPGYAKGRSGHRDASAVRRASVARAGADGVRSDPATRCSDLRRVLARALPPLRSRLPPFAARRGAVETALRSARVHHVSERLRAQGRLRRHLPRRHEAHRARRTDHRHTHGIPATSILEGALVLANTIGFMPVGVHLAIVDPGVGGPRRALALRDAEGRTYVGPDNGLLIPAASRTGIDAAHELANPVYALDSISRTFHGGPLCSRSSPSRDRRTARRARAAGRSWRELIRLDLPEPTITDDAISATLLYVDSFGNIALNLDRDDVKALGIVFGNARGARARGRALLRSDGPHVPRTHGRAM